LVGPQPEREKRVEASLIVQQPQIWLSRRDKVLDVFEAIKTRRSIRKYKPYSIPLEELRRILETARIAPSAGNRQPWRFIVVRDERNRNALAKMANNQLFIADAAAIVVATGDPQVSQKWHARDVMIAVEHMVLAATALGYGTCWIGAFDEAQVKKLLHIPEQIKVVALLPIGTPGAASAPRPRKEMAELFFEEEYGTPIELS
jgi:nitroreductase